MQNHIDELSNACSRFTSECNLPESVFPDISDNVSLVGPRCLLEIMGDVRVEALKLFNTTMRIVAASGTKIVIRASEPLVDDALSISSSAYPRSYTHNTIVYYWFGSGYHLILEDYLDEGDVMPHTAFDHCAWTCICDARNR